MLEEEGNKSFSFRAGTPTMSLRSTSVSRWPTIRRTRRPGASEPKSGPSSQFRDLNCVEVNQVFDGNNTYTNVCYRFIHIEAVLNWFLLRFYVRNTASF